MKEVVRSDQMPLMHGQLASLSTAADDWNDTEVGEESEIDFQHDYQECRACEASGGLAQTVSLKRKREVTHAIGRWITDGSMQ